jgi:hypothetical protein
VNPRRPPVLLAVVLGVLALVAWLAREVAVDADTRDARLGESVDREVALADSATLEPFPSSKEQDPLTPDVDSGPEVEPPEVLRARPPGRVRLSLTVVNDRRLAIPNAWTVCVPIEDPIPAEERRRMGSTQSRFEHWVDPGEYHLVVTAPRHGTYRDRLVVPEGVEELEHEIVLVAPHQVLAVLARREGSQSTFLAGETRKHFSVFATLEVIESRDLRALGAAHAESSSWLRPASEEAATRLEWVLTVGPERPLFVHLAFGNRIIATRTISAGEDRAHFDLDVDLFSFDPARLRARIVDSSSGAGVMGAVLELQGHRGTSDDRGEVVLEGLSAIPSEWKVSAAEYESLRGRVVAEAGATIELGTIAIDPATTIEGTLVDEHGRPVDARVVLAPDTEAFDALHARRHVRSELELDRGRFRFEGVGRQRHRLFVRDERWIAEPLVVDTRGGDALGLQLRVVPGRRVRVHVAGPSAEFLVVDDRGEVACHDELHADATVALAPGRYRIRARVDGRASERTVEVGLDGAEVELGP